MAGGRGLRPDRRPMHFWTAFNNWWREFYSASGRRPDREAIEDWYNQHAADVWGDHAPSLKEATKHAKAMRSVEEVLDFTARNRARLQEEKRTGVPQPRAKPGPKKRKPRKHSDYSSDGEGMQLHHGSETELLDTTDDPHDPHAYHLPFVHLSHAYIQQQPEQLYQQPQQQSDTLTRHAEPLQEHLGPEKWPDSLRRFQERRRKGNASVWQSHWVLRDPPTQQPQGTEGDIKEEEEEDINEQEHAAAGVLGELQARGACIMAAHPPGTPGGLHMLPSGQLVDGLGPGGGMVLHTGPGGAAFPYPMHFVNAVQPGPTNSRVVSTMPPGGPIFLQPIMQPMQQPLYIAQPGPMRAGSIPQVFPPQGVVYAHPGAMPVTYMYPSPAHMPVMVQPNHHLPSNLTTMTPMPALELSKTNGHSSNEDVTPTSHQGRGRGVRVRRLSGSGGRVTTPKRSRLNHGGRHEQSGDNSDGADNINE